MARPFPGVEFRAVKIHYFQTPSRRAEGGLFGGTLRKEQKPNTSPDKMLGVNSAKLQRAGYPVNGQHVGGNTVVNLVRFRVAHYFVEGVLHDVE